jgi:hypothetical protein
MTKQNKKILTWVALAGGAYVVYAYLTDSGPLFGLTGWFPTTPAGTYQTPSTPTVTNPNTSALPSTQVSNGPNVAAPSVTTGNAAVLVPLQVTQGVNGIGVIGNLL